MFLLLLPEDYSLIQEKSVSFLAAKGNPTLHQSDGEAFELNSLCLRKNDLIALLS